MTQCLAFWVSITNFGSPRKHQVDGIDGYTLWVSNYMLAGQRGHIRFWLNC